MHRASDLRLIASGASFRSGTRVGRAGDRLLASGGDDRQCTGCVVLVQTRFDQVLRYSFERQGEVKAEFRHWTIVSSDFARAARGTLAALVQAATGASCRSTASCAVRAGGARA